MEAVRLSGRFHGEVLPVGTIGRRRGLATTIVLVLLMTACTESQPGESREPGTTLHIAFQAELPPPDPDVFYDIEGLQVTNQVYEGLVQYAPDSSEIVPALAESWEVSPDGLTYTFRIRSEVSFHDGTALTPEAIKTTFERRIEVAGGPSYMLADVAKMSAPDERTFVVELARPVSAFLDHLASPYGPKAISPDVLKEHQGDLAQEYLTRRDAGTGPYMIEEIVTGQRYVLTAFPNYWGEKPHFTRVEIALIPNVATQRLMLEAGELDIVSRLPTSDVEALTRNPRFAVYDFPTSQKVTLFINPNDGIFADPTMRQALRQAVDRAAVIEPALGEAGEVSNQFYPAGALPEGLAEDNPPHDPSKLRELTAALDEPNVDIAYAEGGGPARRRMAELLQTQLQALGLNATVRGIDAAQIYELPTNPRLRSDLLLIEALPDDLHPDSFIRIFFATGGPVNWLGCSVPAADAAMDAGLASTSQQERNLNYARAAELILEAGCAFTLGDRRDVFVMRSDLVGIAHDSSAAFSLRLEQLSFG